MALSRKESPSSVRVRPGAFDLLIIFASDPPLRFFRLLLSCDAEVEVVIIPRPRS